MRSPPTAPLLLVTLALACGSTDDETVPIAIDHGDVDVEAKKPPPPKPDAGSTADAGSDAGAADAAGDAGSGVVHEEFPERGYPNGWLVASQGNSPNLWAPASIGGASALDVFTSDTGGGGSCKSNAQCPASQCVGGICRQRVKQRSPRSDFGYGTYEWRVWVAAPSPASAQVSAGAFVYADDAHELDFECGPGKAADRASATLPHAGGGAGPAGAGEILCWMTSQGNPFVSTPVAVTSGAWHTLGLALGSGTSGRYLARWRVDGAVVQSQQLAFGPADACAMYVAGRKCTWQAFVSVENLSFIGDAYPKTRNDAYFDWFRFTP